MDASVEQLKRRGGERREGGSVRGEEGGSVCVGNRERGGGLERARVRACVCVREREKERERE